MLARVVTLLATCTLCMLLACEASKPSSPPPPPPKPAPPAPRQPVQSPPPATAVPSDVIPCAHSPAPRELLSAKLEASALQVFASAGGFDLFWRTKRAGAFPMMYASADANGQLQGAPVELVPDGANTVTAGEPGTFAIMYSERAQRGTIGHVRVVQPRARSVAWDVTAPTKGEPDSMSRGLTAAAWDPAARQWLVFGSELFLVPEGAGKSVTFHARLDEHGHWAQPPSYDPPGTGPIQAGGIASNVVWQRDHLAHVTTTPHGSVIREVWPDHTHDVAVALPAGLTGGRLLALPDGFVLADAPDRNQIAFVTIHEQVVSSLRRLSDPSRSGSSIQIATDGKRIVFAWNEDELTKPSGNLRTSVHAAVLEADGTLTCVYDSQTPLHQHDMLESLVWTGRRFALVHTQGINPSAHVLVEL